MIRCLIGCMHCMALHQKLSARLINQNQADWSPTSQHSVNTLECDNHLEFSEGAHPAALLDPHQRQASTHASKGFGLSFKHPHVRRTWSLSHCQQTPLQRLSAAENLQTPKPRPRELCSGHVWVWVNTRQPNSIHA